ncbi:MAG: host attachment protein [Endozoicomonas sp.]|uniref:host attachment protein n=1 Tax=Endozoicomonas sp. TaxID=1892382 RepID=UPI003D9ADB82
MKKSWVLVADNSQARVYELTIKPVQLILVDQYDHPEGKWRNQELVSDRAGNTPSAMGKMANRAVGTDASPKETESFDFARELAGSINHAHDLNQFKSLQICSPPKLLGEILPNLKKGITIEKKVNKDLVKEDEEVILKYLHTSEFPAD